MDNHSERARSFGKQASLYERLRPGYPADLINALLPEPGRRVVDVGAGTGKLTAALAAAGHAVVAVEPDPDMRATLATRLPDVEVLEGTGEALPVADRSADAVCYGQSWHWVVPEDAAREARRVLTDGGVLGLIWNISDNREPWVKELLANTYPGHDPLREIEAPVIAGFGPASVVQIPWRQRLTPAEMVELVGTWSRISTSAPARRDALLGAVRDVVMTHPDLVGMTEIEFPYVALACGYEPI